MAKARKEKLPDSKPLEQTLCVTADKLRKNIDASEYKHYVLGLLFLKYVSDAFEEPYQKIVNMEREYAYDDPEDKLVYSSQFAFMYGRCRGGATWCRGRSCRRSGWMCASDL